MKIAGLQTLLDSTGLLGKQYWWPGTELNRRHKDFQSSALPTELPGPVLRGAAKTEGSWTPPASRAGRKGAI